MGISTGKTGTGDIADINMTPMIDVLLVLLVIFIIVQQQLQRTFDIQLPVDQNEPTPPSQNDNIVMEITSATTVLINTAQVAPQNLESRLREIYTGRPKKVIFVKAAPDVEYGKVIEYIDIARAAGVTVVGAVLTPALSSVSNTGGQ